MTSVAIVGGGLAGLAAGCALADSGFRVSLFERKPYLGGRASSYEHPGTGEVVDNCQHVLLGCCTNLLDFYRRIGVQDKIRWYDRLTFIEPGGRRSVLGASALPAPLHSLLSFLRAGALSAADKLAIARAMLALVPGTPADSRQSFLDWLRAHGQTERAIQRFWKVVLVSALNEDLERTSAYYGAMVFRESFLKSVAAGRLGVPTVPLTDLYNAAGDFIRARGGEIHLRASVEKIACHPQRAAQPRVEGPLSLPAPSEGHGFSRAIERPDTVHPERTSVREGSAFSQVRLCVNGADITADWAVLAVPFDVLARILPDNEAAQPLRAQLAQFETSPITGIHLWFDRPITELDHAVLLDRTIQWMFHKSKLLTCHLERGEQPRVEGPIPSYIELVVSSSKALIEKSRSEILNLALGELAEFFPEVRQAAVLKSTVIKEVHATYSPRPGSDLHRPTAATPWPNVLLSGDWTATGWPATMESAVRSGYLAAEALSGRKLLVHDLPSQGFMRFFR
jgi:zeta-carotene desaturase